MIIRSLPLMGQLPDVCLSSEKNHLERSFAHLSSQSSHLPASVQEVDFLGLQAGPCTLLSCCPDFLLDWAICAVLIASNESWWSVHLPHAWGNTGRFTRDSVLQRFCPSRSPLARVTNLWEVTQAWAAGIQTMPLQCAGMMAMSGHWTWIFLLRRTLNSRYTASLLKCRILDWCAPAICLQAVARILSKSTSPLASWTLQLCAFPLPLPCS